MLEVRLVLEDRNERAWFGRMMDDLEAYRFKREHGAPEAAEESKPADPQAPPAAEELPPIVDAEYSENAPPAAPVIAHIDAAGAVKVPTDTQMFDAVRESLRNPKVAYEGTFAILKKHGVEKVTDPMTPEVKIALYAELTAK